MTPLAKLFIRKVKQYKRDCDANFLQAQVLDVTENVEDEGSAKRKNIFFCKCCLRCTLLNAVVFCLVPQLNVTFIRLESGRHVR